jgi:biotin transporter BioY
MFAGIGIGVVMLTGKPGYIILFMGVAFIVASFFEKKNDNEGQPPKI